MWAHFLKLLAGVLVIGGVALPTAAPAQFRGRGDYAPPPGYYDRRELPPRGEYRDTRRYVGQRFRCDRGSGGTILSAIAGGLLGGAVSGRGDRGAGAGVLTGRANDRDC